jgi:PiT family inorganic phosphate transporter
MQPLIVLTFVAALAFDYVNGFHDAANSIATVVTTRVLSPRLAVAWAAFFNFVAVFVLGTGVAMTVGTGVVDPASITVPVIFAALIGAIIWNILTWWFGLPSSSSHALIGGLAGAVIAFKGPQLLKMGMLLFIASFIIISPLMGMILGMFNQAVVLLMVRRSTPRTINRTFRRLQLVSAAIYSISHGTNDAQKTMGILFALLVAGGQLPPTAKHIPYWIIFLSYAVIAAGTLAGGVRIIRTMGSKLTKLDPMHGFCAETGGGVTILAVSHFGIPVSTTHTITGAIAGVGMTSGLKSVRWLVAARILWAWILTIPVAGLIAGLFYLAYSAIF